MILPHPVHGMLGPILRCSCLCGFSLMGHNPLLTVSPRSSGTLPGVFVIPAPNMSSCHMVGSQQTIWMNKWDHKNGKDIRDKQPVFLKRTDITQSAVNFCMGGPVFYFIFCNSHCLIRAGNYNSCFWFLPPRFGPRGREPFHI